MLRDLLLGNRELIEQLGGDHIFIDRRVDRQRPFIILAEPEIYFFPTDKDQAQITGALLVSVLEGAGYNIRHEIKRYAKNYQLNILITGYPLT